MTVTPNALLDLADGIGQVKMAIRYYVVSRVNERIGTLAVDDPNGVDVDTDGNAKRSLRGLSLPNRELADVNLYVDRLCPTMVLEDGTEWPCGVFYFVDDVLLDDPATSRRQLTLLDGDCLLMDPFTETYSVPPYGSLAAAANEIADQCGILWREIPDTGAYVADPMVWPGKTPRKQALQAICTAAGWLPPYFDNRGYLIIRALPNLDRSEPDHVYSRNGGRVLRATVATRQNLLSAPNRHVVTNNGPTTGEITAEATVDPALPFSREQRGRTITEWHEQQGIGSTAQAANMAATYASVDPGSFLAVEFMSTPDPRHDMFEVVQWDGVNMREVSWSLPLDPGRQVEMRHVLARAGFASG